MGIADSAINNLFSFIYRVVSFVNFYKNIRFSPVVTFIIAFFLVCMILLEYTVILNAGDANVEAVYLETNRCL